MCFPGETMLAFKRTSLIRFLPKIQKFEFAPEIECIYDKVANAKSVIPQARQVYNFQ